MKTEMDVAIERPARKGGADRYVEPITDFKIYIPQSISRPSGQPVNTIHLTFEPKEK